MLYQPSCVGWQSFEPANDHHKTAFSPGVLQRHESEPTLSCPAECSGFGDHGNARAERHHPASRLQTSYAHPHTNPYARACRVSGQVLAQGTVARQANELAAQRLGGGDTPPYGEGDTPPYGEGVSPRNDQY